MTKKKKVLVIMIVISFLTIAVLLYLFAWRWFGYRFCTSPDDITLHIGKGLTVYVGEGDSKLSDEKLFSIISSSHGNHSRYFGHKYEINGSTLELGIEYKNLSLLGGMPVEINIDSDERIDKVILRGGGKSKVYIYDYETDKWNKVE